MATNEDIGSSQVEISGEGYDKKCIFCKIVNKEMGTELLHSVCMTRQDQQTVDPRYTNDRLKDIR